MSRLESGIIRLKPEQSSLNDIVMQAVKTVYAKARDKNITITFDCGQTFEALLDFNWTAEAVTNVLDNAVKYTPSGGVVDLKSPNIHRICDWMYPITELAFLKKNRQKSSADFTVESSQQELTV